MNIGRLVGRSAARFGDRVAVVDGSREWTFREMDRAANRIANALLALGLVKGDRVGVLFDNCAEMIQVQFALAKAGLVWTRMHPRDTVREHRYVLVDSDARLVLCQTGFADLVAEACREVPGVERIVVSGGPARDGFLALDAALDGVGTQEPGIPVADGDPYTLMYTSGTTGRPKGALHTHGSYVAFAVRNYLLDHLRDLTSEDVLLHVGPLSFWNAFFALSTFVVGGRQVIMSVRDPMGELMAAIDRHHVTILPLAVPLLLRLLASPDLERHDLGTLRTILYGGAPMPVDKLEVGLRRFGQIFCQGYGQTEAPSFVTILEKWEHRVDDEVSLARLGSIGRECLLTEVRVVDEQLRDVAPGEVGEIATRGDHAMAGYWKLPEATAETVRDGWVLSGDLATIDADGYIRIVDRRRLVIRSGSFNVYPREVEDVIHAHPAVQEVIVLGVPDEEWGEAVKAVVVLKPGALVGEAEIIEHCRREMAGYKKPRSVDFVDRLPLGPTGKVARQEVRERYWQGHERRVH